MVLTVRGYYSNYCILYVYVSDLYPTRSGSVWILEVDDLEINGGTGPRAVLCLVVSPGMDAVMCVCYLIISLSSARHVCSSQFKLASLASHMSRLR